LTYFLTELPVNIIQYLIICGKERQNTWQRKNLDEDARAKGKYRRLDFHQRSDMILQLAD
jgi:hypothetical protein